MEHFCYFGPFPAKFKEIASPETVQPILWLMQEIPIEKTTPFIRTTEKKVNKRDNKFMSNIMELD